MYIILTSLKYKGIQLKKYVPSADGAAKKNEKERIQIYKQIILK